MKWMDKSTKPNARSALPPNAVSVVEIGYQRGRKTCEFCRIPEIIEQTWREGMCPRLLRID